jgi:hypothetical protein
VILVSGTKRSGTSMWMQILKAAGLPIIGEAFMGHWEQSIKGANPRGFYESTFRRGIHDRTNPDPETGTHLTPEATRHHAVKVFIPGLQRSDRIYIDAVVATVRSWRQYSGSLARLYAMEDTWLSRQPPDEQGRDRLDVAREGRGQQPAPVEWWFENYELIRDLRARRYPLRFVSYERLLEDPERTITGVLEWLGTGDPAAGAAVVERDLCTQRDAPPPHGHGIDPACLEVFDELYERLHHGRTLDSSFLQRLDETHEAMEARWGHLPRQTDL